MTRMVEANLTKLFHSDSSIFSLIKVIRVVRIIWIVPVKENNIYHKSIEGINSPVV